MEGVIFPETRAGRSSGRTCLWPLVVVVDVVVVVANELKGTECQKGEFGFMIGDGECGETWDGRVFIWKAERRKSGSKRAVEMSIARSTGHPYGYGCGESSHPVQMHPIISINFINSFFSFSTPSLPHSAYPYFCHTDRRLPFTYAAGNRHAEARNWPAARSAALGRDDAGREPTRERDKHSVIHPTTTDSPNLLSPVSLCHNILPSISF